MAAQLSSTVSRSTPPAARPSPGSNPGRLPTAVAPRPRRNPKWIALGVVFLCLGALGSFVLYNQLADARDVVAVRQSVSRGEVITAADLGVVRVGTTPGVATVPASQLTSLVGQHAGVDLVASTLLAPGTITSVVEPAVGHSLVGIKLTTGRAPAGFLRASSPIRLIAIPPTGAAVGYRDAYSDLSIDATVVDATPAADGQSMVLDVDVQAGQAASAALLAATDRLVAVRDPEH